MIISGVEVGLRFDMRAMTSIEEKFGSVDDGMNALKDKSRMFSSMIRLITIMGNSELIHSGCSPVLTEEWIERNMNPGQVQEAMMEVSAAVSEGFKRRVEDKQDDAPVDEILAELQKKMAKDAR